MSDDELARIQELKQEQKELSARFQELALRFEAEIARRQSESGATRDAFSDVRDAIDRLGDDLQRWADKIYMVEREAHGHDGSIGNLVAEFAEFREVVRKEHNLLHGRISSLSDAVTKRLETVRKEARDSVETSESRILRLARDWGPLVVTGLLATLLGMRYV